MIDRKSPATVLAPCDIWFFQVLTNGVPGLEIGTGRLPRFMGNAPARHLWRCGYVDANPWHFRGGWSGLRYTITRAGIEAKDAMAEKVPGP